MTADKVSVLVVTHDRPELLKKALKSVAEQTYSDIEVVIVENFVSKQTKQVVDEFNNCFEGDVIRVNTSEFVNGSEARNLGIENCNSEFVAFLDDDDEWISTKIEKQMDLILNSEDKVGLVYTGLRRVIGNKFYDVPANEKNSGDNFLNIFSSIPAVTSAILVKKSLLRMEKFDVKQTHWQEYDLLVRMSSLTYFAVVPDPETIIRDDFTSKKRMSNQLDKWILAVERFESKHHNRIQSLPRIIQKNYKTQLLKDRIQRMEQQSFGGWLKSRLYILQLIKNSKNWKYLLFLIPNMKFSTIQNWKSNSI